MTLNKVIYLVVLFGAFVYIVSANVDTTNTNTEQKNCKKTCPLKQRWICGFNGTTYRFFANKCLLDKFNCVKKEEYSNVERKLCQKAHQEHHKAMIGNHHHTNKMEASKAVNNCMKCNAGYKPVCGYNGETNLLFKNVCHMKRFNCFHTDKEHQATQLNNCPIPVSSKPPHKEHRKGNRKGQNQPSKEVEKSK